MSKKVASFYCGPGRMMLVSQHLTTQNHQHTFIQITFTLDGSFNVWTEGTGWFKSQAILINSNVPHALKDFQGKQVTFGISPDAVRGANLQTKLLLDKEIMTLPVDQLEDWWSSFITVASDNMPCQKAFELFDKMIDKLTEKEEFHGVIDSRIMDTIFHIYDSLHADVSAESLAARVHLSTDRFLHLFKDQLGLPLRQYVLLQRCTVSTRAFFNGMSLKQAAYEGGFSDPAHFSQPSVNSMVPTHLTTSNKRTCITSSFASPHVSSQFIQVRSQFIQVRSQFIQ